MPVVYYITKKKKLHWRGICSLGGKSSADLSVLWAEDKRGREKQALGGSEWTFVKEQ